MWECLCDCGNTIVVSSNHLTTNNTQSCGCLFGHSVGELKIAELLQRHDIKYKQEYIFPDLPGYRYDFAILNNSNEVVQLIEFDGEQHYKDCLFFNSTAEEQQKIDSKKTHFAQKKGIRLVRIPFYKRDTMTFEDLEIDI